MKTPKNRKNEPSRSKTSRKRSEPTALVLGGTHLLAPLRFYRVIGIWRTGNEVSSTYTTRHDVDRRVHELKQNPAIATIRVRTYGTQIYVVSDILEATSRKTTKRANETKTPIRSKRANVSKTQKS